MNAAQQRAEAKRIVNAAGANAAANADAPAASNFPPVVPAAVLLQVVIGNDALLRILAAMPQPLAGSKKPERPC
jgi:hypothetical protein